MTTIDDATEKELLEFLRQLHSMRETSKRSIEIAESDIQKSHQRIAQATEEITQTEENLVRVRRRLAVMFVAEIAR